MSTNARAFNEGDPPTAPAEPQQLAQRVLRQVVTGSRYILGVVGLPGTGKSTLAAHVAAALKPHTSVVIVPMDGFHLGQAIIRDTPLAPR